MRFILGAIAAIVLAMGGCAYFSPYINPNYANRLGNKGGETVQILLESPTMERMVREASQINEQLPDPTPPTDPEEIASWAKRSRDAMINPGKYLPSRVASIDAMKREPNILVNSGTHARWLGTSKAWCDVSRHSEYIRIRVTDGPHGGASGWVCRTDLHPLAAAP